MRRRLNLSLFEFSARVGFNVASVISAPSGAEVSAERLIMLLRFAAVEEERTPLLDALAKRGVQPSDLSPSLLHGAANAAGQQPECVHA